MRTSRTLPLVALLLLVPALAGCGDGDDGDDGGQDRTSPTSADTSTTSDSPTETTPTDATTEATALPAACDVLTAEEVAAAYGVEFGAATLGGGGYAENDLEWQSDNCEWAAEDLVEVQLALTGPEDFTVGAFTCPEPTAIASTVEPVEDLGDAAYWEVDDAPPLEATLRVCTADYNFDIDVDFEDGVDFQGDPRGQTVALATAVLANLG